MFIRINFNNGKIASKLRCVTPALHSAVTVNRQLFVVG